MHSWLLSFVSYLFAFFYSIASEAKVNYCGRFDVGYSAVDPVVGVAAVEVAVAVGATVVVVGVGVVVVVVSVTVAADFDRAHPRG